MRITWGLPLVVRKAMLRDALRGSLRIIYATHFEHSGAELWKAVKKLELEGIVAKDASSVYTAGRSDRWLKIKTAMGASAGTATPPPRWQVR